jgi:uncharacterized lipoprotein YddW (UPF0748 family)
MEGPRVDPTMPRTPHRVAPAATTARAVLLALLSLAAPGPAEGTPAGGAARGPGASAESTPAAPVHDLWVVRTALLSPEDVDRVVEHARELRVQGLLVQVVGRGDAYYRSSLLPRAEALGTRRTPPGFDPLGELLPRARAAGLQVHAWINCMLVWSAPQRPRDPRHVVNAHPEWVARMRDGRRLSQLSARERARLGIEGVFLSPGHPSVRTWVARVAREVAADYPVDGIHLDYIRQPGVPVGYDMTTRARFALDTGVDPDRIPRLPAPRRAAMDSAWTAFQLAQVTAVVREVRDSLDAVRPGIELSAAVLADTAAAERRHAQLWRAWVRDGLLDRVYLMCYAPPVQTVMDQLVGLVTEFGASERVVPGIAVYNTGPAAAAAKILGARTLGFPRLALYSYDALVERPGYWQALLSGLGLAPARSAP